MTKEEIGKQIEALRKECGVSTYELEQKGIHPSLPATNIYRIQTYVAVRKLEFENYCFEITQVVCAGGRETILQQKRTTHYHKAIGIAVCINS